MTISSLRIEAPAKLNLRLKVTGRRSDGYHDLISIMVPVELFDIIEMEIPLNDRVNEQIKIDSKGINIPSDESNLVYRAADLFLSRTGIKDKVFIHLTKRIPVAAGLGGGSSDAGATLLGLNQMHSMPLSQAELHELAVQIGADVPFFLQGVPVLATGIGDILSPLDYWPELWYIIITPPIRISTAWVYDNLKLELTTGEYDYIVNILKNKTFAISSILENDLEKVTSNSFSIINTLKEILACEGAEGTLMSGSGPSVFGVFKSPEKAKSVKDYLISLDLGDVFMVRGRGTTVKGA